MAAARARVVRADDDVVVACCRVADRPWTRLRGLLGRRSLRPGEGLLIDPSRAVHTIGMRFAIDAVFLDGHGGIVSIAERLRPGRAASCRRARRVLEIAAGEAHRLGLKPGDELRVERRSDQR